jgi:hypothetical protein
MKHEAVILNSKLLISTSGLCEFFNVKPPTITGWTKNWLNEVVVPNEKKKYYDLIETIHLKKIHLNEKHSKNKHTTNKNDSETADDITLPDGRNLSQLNIENPEDLEMLTFHPMGERFLDILKSAEDVSKKKHELAVKKRQWVETRELDILLSEVMSQIKNKLIAIRDQLPIYQADKLVELDFCNKEDKEKIQKILLDSADDEFLEMYDDIEKTMLKRTSKNKKDAISFLKELIQKVEKSI